MHKYYGGETERALKNFPFSTHKVRQEFVRALVFIKKAAAYANFEDKGFGMEISRAISKACDEVLGGKHEQQFLLPALQGGAGTSVNMNVNEVLAGLATEMLNKQNKKFKVHPNDHVNRSMSTNDANPSAVKIAALFLKENLELALENLVKVFELKGVEFKKNKKLGRTHLQDAVPTTLGAEFFSYAATIQRHLGKIKNTSGLLQELNLGGTAIGNSINADAVYIKSVYKNLNKFTGRKFRPAKNLMSLTSSQTDFLAVSQAVTSLCVDLSKIANDIRLLASGPRGGLGEISLKKLQKGSSIMPGKVNPVLPETVNQLYFLVSGNNLAIEHAAHASQLELGVMVPVIADKLLESLKLTTEVISEFAKNCIVPMVANAKELEKYLENSTAFSTLFVPLLGYDVVSEVVKKSVLEGRTLREVMLEKKLVTNEQFEKVINNFKKNVH
ncbi:MAG: aspartate ammonia-lyase [Candidatus Doudnabacteria bacterium]|nr:aspartate ammonia-lyase [Candidatus Doudnabacteria bacterium]